MRERPILMRDHEVRAILSGAKMQTRRPVKYNPLCGEPMAWCSAARAQEPGWVHIVGDYRRFCHVAQPGDLLWVREAHAPRYFDDGRAGYRADYDTSRVGDVVPEPKWTPSIHMRRGDSRLTLRVTDVRVERLRDITEEDARAEGASGGVPWLYEDETYRTACCHLWSDTYGPESWDANPWVWVVSFERVEVSRG